MAGCLHPRARRHLHHAEKLNLKDKRRARVVRVELKDEGTYTINTIERTTRVRIVPYGRAAAGADRVRRARVFCSTYIVYIAYIIINDYMILMISSRRVTRTIVSNRLALDQ